MKASFFNVASIVVALGVASNGPFNPGNAAPSETTNMGAAGTVKLDKNSRIFDPAQSDYALSSFDPGYVLAMPQDHGKPTVPHEKVIDGKTVIIEEIKDYYQQGARYSAITGSEGDIVFSVGPPAYDVLPDHHPLEQPYVISNVRLNAVVGANGRLSGDFDVQADLTPATAADLERAGEMAGKLYLDTLRTLAEQQTSRLKKRFEAVAGFDAKKSGNWNIENYWNLKTAAEEFSVLDAARRGMTEPVVEDVEEGIVVYTRNNSKDPVDLPFDRNVILLSDRIISEVDGKMQLHAKGHLTSGGTALFAIGQNALSIGGFIFDSNSSENIEEITLLTLIPNEDGDLFNYAKVPVALLYPAAKPEPSP